MSSNEPSKPSVTLDYGEAPFHSANFTRIADTSEEVIIDFGLQSTGRMRIDMQASMVLSPHTAKRLFELLGRVLNQHEVVYGPIELDAEKRRKGTVTAMQEPSSEPNE